MKNQGLVLKYIVQKANGEPVDDNAEYFILRLDQNGSDQKHITACRAAALNYACIIKDHLPLLAKDIVSRYGDTLRPLSSMTPDELRYVLGEPGLADQLCESNIQELSASLWGLCKTVGSYGNFDSFSKLQELEFDIWFLDSWMR